MKILNEKKLFRISLQFFADGNGGDGSATGEGTAGETANQSENIDDLDLYLAEFEQKHGVKNGAASAQAVAALNAKREIAQPEQADEDAKTAEADAEAAPAVADPKSVEEEFDELIKSEKYRDIYGKKVANTVSARLKNHADAEAEAAQYKEALSLLATKYGKSKDDIPGIIAAIGADDELLEDEAFNAGKTVAELRTERDSKAAAATAEKQINQLKTQLTDMQNREAARADAERWSRESLETKKLYPSFDLRSELKNADFLKFLRSGEGMSVTDAYEHAHLKEIMAAQLSAAERRADENAAKVVSRNSARVVENGNAFKQTSSQSRIDVRNMTDADFDRIEEMLKRGESVTLNHLR